MKSTVRSALPILALGLGLGLIAACNSLIGAGAPNEVASFAGAGGGAEAGGSAGVEAGPQCLRPSDCPKKQVCLFRVCSDQCVADRDCPLELRCLQTTLGNACIASTSATCKADIDCPDGSLCKEGACRGGCSDDSQCLADQSCLLGACVGNDSMHDPSAGGGSAGESGAGGNSGGATSGGSGVAGNGASGATSGGGGAGGAAATCKLGDASCDNLTPLSCQDGQLQRNGQDCAFVCKAGICSGQCKVGDKRCTDLLFEECDANNKWQPTTCTSVCDETQGCIGSCTIGALQCNGATELDVCTAGSYQPKQTCPTECAKVNGVAKCVACGDADGLCPAGCKNSMDADCPKEPGQTCAPTDQCRTGVCGAEGVCCDVACGNSCSSCKLAGKLGVCTSIDYSKSSDTSNCGSCGNKCSTTNVSVASCSGGVCGGTCSVGYANCATQANDGCETNTNIDAGNCGGCGTTCKYGLCTGGSCASTVWGLTQHSGTGEALGSNGTASILAVPIAIVANTKLAALGLRAYPPSSTVHMYLSLYTSAGAPPGPQTLVAQTALLTMTDVTTGAATEGLIASQPTVTSGNYFVVITSDNLFHAQDETSTQTIWYNSAAVTFAGGGIPFSASMKSTALNAVDAYAVTVP